MKKLFTLIAMAMLAVSDLQAQSIVITKTDGTTVTYEAADVKQIQYLPSSKKLLHSFTGYLIVSSKYFTNAYYGDSATIKIYMDGSDVSCTFHDGVWGDGNFSITMGRGTMTGTGTMTMTERGKTGTYDATLSGSMTNFNITIPSVMGGTTLNWRYGAVPQAYKTQGSYTGNDSLCIGGNASWTYVAADSKVQVTANADSTINITMPEEKFTGTVMGDITQGTFTIKNIPYDAATGTFSKDYVADSVMAHVTCVTGGSATMDKDYLFTTGKVTVTPASDGTLSIANVYKYGNMPFDITAKYVGKK